MSEGTFVCRSCCRPQKNSHKARKIGKRWRCTGCEDGRAKAMQALNERARATPCT